MADQLKKYELMVIFKPLLPDDVRKQSHKSIVERVEKFGGSVKEADVWGKRYLAYKIEGHEEGYYIVYEMELPGAKVNDLRKSLGNINEIIRYMISRVDSAAAVQTKLNKKEIEI
jgi:small subunit ribosomal protein S6